VAVFLLQRRSSLGTKFQLRSAAPVVNPEYKERGKFVSNLSLNVECQNPNRTIDTVLRGRLSSAFTFRVEH
jgi:hypothetical protein